jgi:hypothetical protein
MQERVGVKSLFGRQKFYVDIACCMFCVFCCWLHLYDIVVVKGKGETNKKGHQFTGYLLTLTAFQLLGSGAKLVPIYFYFLHISTLDIH